MLLFVAAGISGEDAKDFWMSESITLDIKGLGLYVRIYTIDYARLYDVIRLCELSHVHATDAAEIYRCLIFLKEM